MITMIIALALASGCFSATYFVADFGLGWSIACGVVTFALAQFLAGLYFKKKVMGQMNRVQNILVNGQKKLQTKMQRWQIRPPGSMQAAQKEIFDDTRVFVREALHEVEGLRAYRFWVPMIERQIATAKLQLHWMIREFKEVDELMPKVLFVDPMMSAIKMARQYMLEAPLSEIAPVYNKAVRRLRYNQNVTLAALYSWILVKRGEADQAFKVLTEALKNSDDATLKQNHTHLMNNRVSHFSNSGLGDAWYSLLLEEPKMRAQRPHTSYR